MNLYELLTDSAESGLSRQRSDGSMPPGHNGPYFDRETPVRNTGHWLITFLKAYEITGNKKFLEGAEKATEYLLSKEARPMKASFWHMRNPEKNFSNGLIGQAWSIEALSASFQYFGQEKIIKAAREVFLLHPFDEKSGFWRRVGVDGSFLPIDDIFNHQLWFAAAGVMLNRSLKDRDISEILGVFMNNVERNLELYPSGLIVHRLRFWKGIKTVKNMVRNYEFAIRRETVAKAVGYHQFNLYAFALLNICLPSHPFWKSKKFRKLWILNSRPIVTRAAA